MDNRTHRVTLLTALVSIVCFAPQSNAGEIQIAAVATDLQSNCADAQCIDSEDLSAVQLDSSELLESMDHSMPEGVMPEGMDHSMPAGAMPEGMDHSMPEGKMPEGMDHSMHEGKMPEGMDHSMPEGKMPEGMDHSMHGGMKPKAMNMDAIPVSDGSAPDFIAMPFPDAMHMEDDPVIGKVILDRFEVQFSDEDSDPLIVEAEAWLGKDLEKLWFKLDLEQVDSETEEAEIELLYSRAIRPYWDLQIGAKRDIKPEKETWLALGIKGLAPYFFETDAAIYAESDGQLMASFATEYEVMLSQRSVLSPEIELSFWGKNEPEFGRGSGLSNLSLSVRYSYAISREFAPYIGVGWNKDYGNTADYKRADGLSTEDSAIAIGIRAWF